RNLSGRGRAELEATPCEVPRGGLEVMRSHALAIAGRAVADGAVVTEHAPAEVSGCPEAATANPNPRAEASRPIAPARAVKPELLEDDQLADHVRGME